MSGVAGVVSFVNGGGDGSAEYSDLQTMLSTMRHRGPDGIKSWQGGNAVLGFCELGPSIGLEDSGYPYFSPPHQLVVMLNGAIHNLPALQSELVGLALERADPQPPQIIAHAYRQWGDDLANHLVGEFVLFIWDVANKELYAARDAVGTRFFYYRQEDNRVEFASESKALLAVPGSKKVINQDRVLDFLAVEFDRDEQVETFYEGILRLPQGHCLKFDLSGLHIWRYWRPENLGERHFAKKSDCVDEFSSILQLAIKDRLAGDQPVASTLSGGLDSSTLVALCYHKLEYSVKTFTLTGQDRGECEDWKHAQRILQDMECESRAIAPNDCIELYREFIGHVDAFDEPFTLTHGLTDLLVLKRARAAGCGVMLDGTAGDILFYSPDKTLNMAAASGSFRAMKRAVKAAEFHNLNVSELRLALRSLRRRMLPETLTGAIRGMLSNRTLANHIEQSYPGNLLPYLQLDTARDYVHDKLAKRREKRKTWAGETEAVKHAFRYLSGEIAFAQENKETTAAYCQMESASPYADRRLVEFALQMPDWAKMAVPSYKWLLRSVGRGLLPTSVVERSDIAAHPGMEFYDCFVKEWSKSYAQTWSNTVQFASISGILDRAKTGPFDAIPNDYWVKGALEQQRQPRNWEKLALDRFTLHLLQLW